MNPFDGLSEAQIAAEFAAPVEALRPGLFPLFGVWFLDTNGSSIGIMHGRHEDAYWVPVNDLKDSASVLNWVAQIAGKGSMAADLGDFVRSIDYLLPMQELFCGRSKNKVLPNPEARACYTVATSLLPCEEPSAKLQLVPFSALKADAFQELREIIACRTFSFGAYGLSLLPAQVSKLDGVP